MGEQLSMLDTMFLELEQADAGAHMHIGAALVFEPPPGGGAPTIEQLREHMRARAGILPRFAQRLSGTHAGPLTWLTWERDERYDVEAHVGRATLPAPGGDAELHDWLADFWSHRLDRHRPLWEMVLLEGLAGGRWALATKTHHCLVDGVGSLDIGHVILDMEPDPPARPPVELPEPTGEHGGGRFSLTPALLLRGARAGIGAALHPRESFERLLAAADLVVREEVIPAPRTSLNAPTSGTRRFATVKVELEQVQAIRARLGGKVNDVVLAVCAGGLRELLLSRGDELPESGLRAQVPVNIRSADGRSLGNELTSLFVELPVAEPDPLERFRRVAERSQQLKQGTQRTGGKTIVEIADAGPPVAGAIIGRLMFGGPRMFNLTITNVPGPRETFYAFGAPLVEVLPLVPLFAGHSVGIAVVSYGGQLVFGLNGDRLTVPDLEVLADGIDRALSELEEIAARSGAGAAAPA